MEACALCKHQKQLERSHIIPEFMYDAMYDEKHRFHVLTSAPNDRNRIEQKGIREYLLCRDCEQKIAKHERYASLVFKGGSPLQYRRDGRMLHLSGIDYTQLKLFQLSVLWRAGISKLPFFEEVALGPHQEKLRNLILSDNPGKHSDYPCLMWGITLEPGVTPGLISKPLRVRALGRITYQFVFGGFVWAFDVASSPPISQFSAFSIQHNGSMPLQVRSVLELPSLRSFVDDMEKLGRLPR